MPCVVVFIEICLGRVIHAVLVYIFFCLNVYVFMVLGKSFVYLVDLLSLMFQFSVYTRSGVDKTIETTCLGRCTISLAIQVFEVVCLVQT